MMSASLLQRITIHPEVCHGKPVIRDTRMMVESILEYIAGGDTIEDLLKEFTYIERDDILASIAYAAKVMHYKNITFPVA